ncbi:MAG TPA: HisA/HisF-related TIM barrel protein [Gemmatimonadales bacterium]|nr:HisA/HisF-related TIM barrel protein [Gemmatimonadales bacterium]
MELIPVLDLLRGQAVHARRGARQKYQPVQSALLPGRVGDAVALARAYHTMMGSWRCYVADLDAIEGWAPQTKLIHALADPEHGFGEGLIVDGGVTTPRGAESMLEAGASMLAVGLETLRGFAELRSIVECVGGDRVIFSLDLLDGRPIQRRTGRVASEEAVVIELAARAADAGVAAVLVLDLAHVGAESGPRNLELIDGLKRLLGVPVYAGGGVRSIDDIELLEEVGCDAVLVASAIHNGTIGPPGKDAGPPARRRYRS